MKSRLPYTLILSLATLTLWGADGNRLTYLDGSSGNDQVALENGGGELGSLTRKSITRILS